MNDSESSIMRKTSTGRHRAFASSNRCPNGARHCTTLRSSAASFNNPDHVNIVIHNYRWHLSLAEGEAKYDDLEKRLAEFRSSPCRPLLLKATPMARRTRTRVPTQRNSPADIRTGLSGAASVTICLRKLLRRSRKLSSTSTVIDCPSPEVAQ